jgi:hypothetical protein
MPFLRQFVSADDCIIGSEFLAECQSEHYNSNRKDLSMFLYAKCGIEKITNINSHRRIIATLQNRNFNVNSNLGDFLIGDNLLSKNCSMDSRGLISRTGGHRGHQFHIFCDPDPVVCFIVETVRMSQNVIYAQRVRVDDTVALI